MALANLRHTFIKRTLIPHIQLTKSLYSTKRSEQCDIVIVGGGVVGLATAREISIQYPHLKLIVVEKEPEIGMHQTTHNSGVIHAGIYYKPGSLKAKLCGEGMRLLYAHCDKHKIPYKKIGKIVVATTPVEVARLNELERRSIANKVPDLQVLNKKEIKQVEPHCEGLKALWSPHTGIMDFRVLAKSYAQDFICNNGKIITDFKVIRFEEGSVPDYPLMVMSVNKQTIRAKYAFTCAGLYSDKLAVMSNCPRDPQIVPFRGEYLVLHPNKMNLVKGNIYPVPDPRFPFLGVHFTPRMDGTVLLGPNAILSFKREGYKWSDFDMSEFTETITYSGFRKMALKYILPGSYEMLKSIKLSLQIKELQRYIPEITLKDVKRGPAGVRAQAMYANGDLVDDFVFSRGQDSNVAKRVLHCRNAPSPAATSSLAIAKYLVNKLKLEFQLR